MSQNASDRGKEKGEGTDNPDYVIDETVTVPTDEPVESWDIDVDPTKEETWVIRAIARSDNTRIRAFILPKEEVEHFKNGENVWWEYRSNYGERLQDATTISNDDEKPYYHDGDYVLAVKARRNGATPDEFKFSLKFRRD